MCISLGYLFIRFTYCEVSPQIPWRSANLGVGVNESEAVQLDNQSTDLRSKGILCSFPTPPLSHHLSHCISSHSSCFPLTSLCKLLETQQWA